MATKRVRVLIVDDSALIRKMMTEILSKDSGIEVLGTAQDPYVAREKIKALNPDVITLDIEMPKMDGIEFLQKIMKLRPMPVLMVSSLTQQGADATLQALELGAVDYVAKPTQDLQSGLAEKCEEIVAKVKAAAGAKVRGGSERGTARPQRLRSAPGYSSTETVVAIGASTGGVEALTSVLTVLPPDSPAILVTQHMPASFTTSFAQRLNAMCAIHVMEARDGVRVLPGHAYLAPGDAHLRLTRSGANYVCRIAGQDRVSGHCPSVDVLYRSVAECAGKNAIGVILTGMGKDGARGLLEMREAGARTLGQNEATSVIYGMPRVAKEIGAVEQQLSLALIPQRILEICLSEKGKVIRV
ncbi:MAG: chemotaxis response regulator protein-glutamate methylesterase [Roseibium sp.]|uniref:protein-glutamate methylesterase/protein-glutamine glutaminase n=1 Tax=Roseibium sp. TaxID=1936156 RepID=UPI001B0794FF|nr:chemotaxis response regulator protein-glutamate methylesterase [Roseibium sp.]MBO6892656.1 chemotaxis response regulator protein-glutamate methylesterase [Roseibium sp.]MBO6928214.1 chemotaxis response regulator protein-glutamate methylesterase [Roseibium sp.]